MRSYLKAEIKKMIRNYFFAASLMIGIFFAFLSVFYIGNIYFSEVGVFGIIDRAESDGGMLKMNILSAQTLYNSWIGADQQSAGAALFYLLSPLLAAMPCGWSFSEELNSGYLHMIVPRKGRRAYFRAKLAVSFVTGGVVLVLPQSISLLLTALYIPAVQPDSIYSMYTPVMHGDMFAWIFYMYPLLYILLLLLINFLFGGLFAWLSLAAAFFTPVRSAAVILPFLLLLAADSAKTLLYYISYIEISPLNLLHPLSAPNYVKLWVVFLWMAVLGSVSIFVIAGRGDKYEIL